MYTDSELFFATLDLPSNPIKPGIEWPRSINKPSEIKRVADDALLPEVKQFIDDIGLKIEFLLLWTWKRQQDDEFYEIHSDGDIDSDHRYVAMNWLVEGVSTVSWYTFNNATAKKRVFGSNTYPLTEWVYGEKPQPLAVWNGNKPALLNIEQPHQVHVLGNRGTPRTSVTIRFSPNLSMQEILDRCKTKIISLNTN
jgi:hypothetical protein